MATSIYKINKGINKSIEFKGLRAQYIWYVAAVILCLMGVFALLYIIGINQYLCIAIIGAAGIQAINKIYRMSHKYGEHGLMKKLAKRKIPKAIRITNRSVFFGNK